MKAPAFQFYPGDWQRDAALRACSIGARGCWIEMICIMHQAIPYGHLRVNSRPIPIEILARMIGASVRETKRFLEELEMAGVFDRDDDGAICSRRMIKDNATRIARINGGRLGGNPKILPNKVNHEVNHEVNLPPTLTPTLTPPPSAHARAGVLLQSSSSSSLIPPLPPNSNSGVSVGQEFIIPRNLDSDRGRSLVEKYAEVQRGQGHVRRHDPVAFQATLSHLEGFSTRKAMGLLAAWIEARQAIPKYDADWESYAPAESDLPPPSPKVKRERKPRVEVPQA